MARESPEFADIILVPINSNVQQVVPLNYGSGTFLGKSLLHLTNEVLSAS